MNEIEMFISVFTFLLEAKRLIRGAAKKTQKKLHTLCEVRGVRGQQNLVCEPQKKVIFGVNSSEKMDVFWLVGFSTPRIT